MSEPAVTLPVVDPLPVVEAPRRRLPEWLRVNLPPGRGQQLYNLTTGAVADNALGFSVC